MRLAGPGLTYEHQRFGFLNVTAFGELMDPRCRDLRSLAEVELLECFHTRQFGFEDAPCNRASLAFFQLGSQQCFQIPHGSILLLHRFFG